MDTGNVDKASKKKTINKTYAEYKQRELNEKGEKTGKVLGKHAISLFSTGISQVVKIIQLDTENDPIIKDHMANLGYFLVCIFGNFLASVVQIQIFFDHKEPQIRRCLFQSSIQ